MEGKSTVAYIALSEKNREELLAAWVGDSLGAERVAALTAEQRAILRLPNASPEPQPEPSTPSR